VPEALGLGAAYLSRCFQRATGQSVVDFLLRTRIQALHNDYQKQFTDDAKSTIADFNKTREDLTRRYNELRGIDANSQKGAEDPTITQKLSSSIF